MDGFKTSFRPSRRNPSTSAVKLGNFSFVLPFDMTFLIQLFQKLFDSCYLLIIALKLNPKQTMNPFHLAIPVNDLEKCRTFYRETLGCSEGRSDDKWVDFNFFGHQLVIHEKPDASDDQKPVSNPVDGKAVPIPHFGVVLDWDKWEALAAQLKSINTKFIIEPYIRFQGEVGEQATMFFLDPEDNALEFKAFKDMGQLFEK